MPTKKPAAKKAKVAVSIDHLMAKGVGGVTAELAGIQIKTRDALMVIGDALAEKMEEVTRLNSAIADKKSELEELATKEDLLQSVQELAEGLEDKRRQHSRQLTELAEDKEDRIKQLNRELAESREQAKREAEDEALERRRAIEDEDRQRMLEFEDKRRALKQQEAEFNDLQLDAATFDTRVDTEVAKRSAAIRREVEFSHMKRISELMSNATILEGHVQSLSAEKQELKDLVQRLEQRLEQSQTRLAAIATSALDKEAGTAALDELRSVAHKQAESKK